MERVFFFVSDRNLGVCAQVCKLWRDEVKRARKQRRQIHIDSEAKLRTTRDFLRVNSRWRISTLSILGIPLDNPIFLEIVRRVKGTISSLELVDREKTFSTRTLHPTILACPELFQLQIFNPIYIQAVDQTPLIPILATNGVMQVFPNILNFSFVSPNPVKLLNVLRTFPKLNSLVIVDPIMENSTEFRNIQMQNLGSLQIILVRRRREVNLILQCLLNLNLKLTMLVFTNFTGADTNLDLLKRFIESQAPTLRVLEIGDRDLTGMPYSSTRVTPLPLNLPNLTLLNIEKSHLKNMTHITNYFPSLRAISFNFHPNSNWTGIFPKKPLKVRPNVNRLSLEWIDNSSLNKLLPTFCNITDLRLANCDDAQAQIVFGQMVQLTDLCLEDGDFIEGVRKLTDEGFTGICPAKFQKIEKRGLKPQDVRVGSYLGNLKGYSLK